MAHTESADGASTPGPGPGTTGVATGRWRRPLSPRLVFWWTFGLVFTLTALWSVANPPMAGLDEPAHAVKAASVVRGELTGEPFDGDPTAPLIVRAQQEGRGLVDVTALFAQLNVLPNCFATFSAVPATCQTGIVADPDAAAEAVTSASRYNPLYYAIVGLPSLLPGSEWTIYLMRLVSALLAAALIAMALRTLAEVPRSLWPAIATTVAVTPMVMFMNSTVNPQAPELAGALAVWVTMLALLRHPDPDLLRRRLTRLTVATLFFVNARGLGPLFLVVVVLAAVACSPLPALVALLRDRRTWPYLGGCVAVGLAAVGWIVFVGSLVSSPTVNFPEYADADTILQLTAGNTSVYITQSLGLFGWQDVTLPGWTHLVLAAMLAFVVFAGFVVARWRDRLVMVALGVISVVTPLIAQYVQARYIGPFWQGRYILPLAFGVPIVAGFALQDRVGGIPAWITRRLVGWGFAAVAVMQTVAFGVNLHRYVNGSTGDWFSTSDGSWSPPLTPWLMMTLTAAGWAALAVVVFRGSLRGARGVPPGDAAVADTGAAAGVGSDRIATLGPARPLR